MTNCTTERIVLDTDPGIDDALALYLALASPELEVVALTTVFGNTNVQATTRNALNLLQVAGRLDIPVAQGAARPLAMPLNQMPETAEFVHGDDAMGNMGWSALLDRDARPVSISAAQLIVETLMAQPGQITLVAIGPLTNLALALHLCPQIASAARRVVIMGGCVHHSGNVSPVAEANIHNDPHAAALVLSAGWDVTLVPLDVTEKVQLDDAFFEALRASPGTCQQLLARAGRQYQAFHKDWYGYEEGRIDAHDPTAIAYLTHDALFAGERYSVTVVPDGPAKGATVADRRGKFYSGSAVRCLTEVDGSTCVDLMWRRLVGVASSASTHETAHG